MFRGRLHQLDFLLLGLMLLIFSFGLVMIYSTTLGADSLAEGRGAFNLQLIYFLLGLCLFAFLSYLDYRIFLNWTVILYGVVIVLLLFVLLAGKTVLGAMRWIDLGFMQVQPSEISKFLLLLVMAALLAKRSRFASHAHFILLSAVMLALPIILVLMQPDLGTAIIFLALWAGMMVGIGIDRHYLLLISASFVAAAPFVWPLLKPYQRQRVQTFLDPTLDPQGSGYNVIQAIIAIGSGGILGVGLGKGTQSQFKFLPVRHTDFIFSVIGEELGLVGSSALIILFGFLLWRILRVSRQAVDNFGRYLCLGVFCMLGAQSFINIGMNLGIMPVTGIPLPLISSGGTSLWVTLSLLGIVQSVYRISLFTRDQEEVSGLRA